MMRQIFTRPWFWAWAVVVFVFPLIWVGGLVTTHDAGMAVPDWPGTYGYNLFLYPISAWIYGPFDLFIEHGHRLLASFVGILAIVLCCCAWFMDERRWYRWACIGLLTAIICQGLLGGFRVVLDARTIAMIHGIGGPLVFAYATFLAIAASSDWRNAKQDIEPRGLHRLALGLVILTVLQLTLGAQLRHALPDLKPSLFMALVHMHLTVAVVLVAWIGWIAWKVRSSPYRHHKAIRAPANALVLVLLIQVGLGVVTWIVNYALPWPELTPGLAKYVILAKGYWESLVVTAHQATGAWIISLAVWLACRIGRRQAQLALNPQLRTIAASSIANGSLATEGRTASAPST